MAEQTFLDFVESKRAEGRTDAEIKQAMREQGFRNEDYSKPLSEARKAASLRKQESRDFYAADADKAIKRTASAVPTKPTSTPEVPTPAEEPASSSMEEEATASGSSEQQASLRKEYPQKPQELRAEYFARIKGYAKGIGEFWSPSDEELRRQSKAEENEAVSRYPGETTAEGVPLKETSWSEGLVKAAPVAVQQSYKAAREEAPKRVKETHPIVRIAEDVYDLATALPKLTAEAVLPRWVPVGSTPEQVAAIEEKSGKEFAKETLGAAVGGTLATALHPIEQAESRPVSTAAQFLPALQAGKALGKIAMGTRPGRAAAAAASTVATATEAAASKASRATGLSRVANAVQDVVATVDDWMYKRGVPDDLALGVRRWFADGLDSGDPQATAIIEKIALDPDSAGSHVSGVVERIAGKVARKELPSITRNTAPEQRHSVAPAAESAQYGPTAVAEMSEPSLLAKGESAAPMQRRPAIEEIFDNHPELADDLAAVADATYTKPVPKRANFPSDSAYRAARSVYDQHAAQIADRVLSVLDAEAGMLIKSPAFRKEVLKRTLRAFSEQGVTVTREVATKVKQAIEMAATDGVEQAAIAAEELGGPNILLSNIVRETSAAAKPGVLAEALRVVQGELGEEATKAARTKAIEVEKNRYRTTASEQRAEMNMPREIAREFAAEDLLGQGAQAEFEFGQHRASAKKIIKAVLDRGEPVPVLLPKELSPARLASEMRRIASEMTPDQRAKYARPIEALAKKIDKFVELDPLVLGAGYGEKNAVQSLAWHERARVGVNDPAIAPLTRMMKHNQTARNFVGAVNNLGSNVGQRMIRKGQDPITVITDLVSEGLLYAKWKNGRKVSPERNTFYKALEESGAMDTDALKADIGAVHHTLDVGKLPGLKQLYEGADFPIPGVGKVRVGVEPLYRSGDNLFKLSEAWDNWSTLRDYYTSLGDGKTMQLKVSPRRSVVLKREGDNVIISDPLNVTKTKKVPASVAGSVVDSILARAALEPILGVTFNYADTGLFGKWLKTAPLIGTKSAFYTYFSKALDIPFAQEGLIGKAIKGVEMPVITDSPYILGKQASEAMLLSARRALLINGLATSLRSQDQHAIGQAFDFKQADDKTKVLSVLSNPGYIASAPFGSWNYADATMTMFKAAAGAYVNATKPSRQELYPERFPAFDPKFNYVNKKNLKSGKMVPLEQLTPEQRKIRALLGASESGELTSASAWLQLVGLTGDAIQQTLAKISNSDEAGAVFDLDEAFASLAGSLVGPIPTRAVDVASAYTQRDKAAPTFTTRKITADPQLTIPLTAWAIRKFTGLGWDIKSLADQRLNNPYGYFGKMRKEWEAALGVSKNLRAGRTAFAVAKRLGNAQEMADAREQIRQALISKAVVRYEVNNAFKRYNELAKKMLNRVMEVPVAEIDDDDTAAAEVMEKPPEETRREMDALVQEAMEPTPTLPAGEEEEDDSIPDAPVEDEEEAKPE